jgi:hypothetical protein
VRSYPSVANRRRAESRMSALVCAALRGRFVIVDRFYVISR